MLQSSPFPFLFLSFPFPSILNILILFQAIPFGRVTQLAVFEEFNLLLLIADKSLFSYQLDAVLSANGGPLPVSNGSSRRAPQKLSGGREVGFFAVGRLKDRTLVLYKKRDGLSSTFKAGFLRCFYARTYCAYQFLGP